MSGLVDKIATKFNLNKDEVQKLFDQDRTEHEAQREKEQATRLQKLVDAGTITATQKTAIEAKVKELKAEREVDRTSAKDLSDEERKSKMDEERTALDSWAKAQGLDLSKLRGVFFGGPGRHGGPAPEQSQSNSN